MCNSSVSRMQSHGICSTAASWQGNHIVLERVREPQSCSSLCVSQVYIIHRRDEFRASKIMQNRALDNPKIEVLWSTVAEEAYGNEKNMLGGLKIRNLKDDTVGCDSKLYCSHTMTLACRACITKLL